MKVLILNPAWTADHPLHAALTRHGITVLQASTVEEAWLLLQMQEATLELLVVNRELRRVRQAPASPPPSTNDGGIAFLAQLRRGSAKPAIPVLLTSELWGPAEFLAHQRSQARASAYLALPCTEQALLNAVSAFAKGPTPAAPIVLSAERPPHAAAVGFGAAAPELTRAPTATIDSAAEDYEVLRTYLMLREKDVVALTAETKGLVRELTELKARYRSERMKCIELEYRLAQEQSRARELERDSQRLAEQLHDERDLAQYRQSLELQRHAPAKPFAPAAEPAPTASTSVPQQAATTITSRTAAPPASPATPAELHTSGPLERDFDAESVYVLKSKSSATN